MYKYFPRLIIRQKSNTNFLIHNFILISFFFPFHKGYRIKEPIYLTTGPSNGDHYYAAGSQKTESIQHAADVLRKLINKLPDKDNENHSDHQQKTINFNVDSQSSFKNIPASVNELPLDSLTHPSESIPGPFSSNNQPQPPPGADPDAYKVYRAMALKLAGTKQVPAHHKKPYLILSDNEFKSLNSRPFPSPANHFQSLPQHHFSHNPKHLNSHNFNSDNFEIQKTLQYEYKDLPEIVIDRQGQQ